MGFLGQGRRRRKRMAQAIIHFRKEYSDQKDKWLPVLYAECGMGGGHVGPVSGHSVSSIIKSCDNLTSECACRARSHVPAEFLGVRYDRAGRIVPPPDIDIE